MDSKNNQQSSKGGKKALNKSQANDEEKITLEDIRKLFIEMFHKHEQSIVQILAANTKMMNDRIDGLSRKVDELQDSLQFTELEVNKNMKKIDENCMNEVKSIKQKLRDLEDRARRNNLRIDGIVENAKESWEDTEEKLQNMFSTKLGLDSIVIERAHRASPTKKQKEKNEPRTIVMKLLNFKDKVNILKNARKLKGTGIYINEDFSKETTDIRKKLWDDVIKLRNQGKYAILQYDRIIQRDHKK